MLNFVRGVVKMLFRCPRCQVQVSAANNSDFIHQCNSGEAALDNEDIKITGNWTDYTGSDFTQRTSQPNVTWQNLGNELIGTEGWVRENVKQVPYSERGANKQIFRQRKHLEYIEDVKNTNYNGDI